jgi:DNA-binding Lrp family transcriptional regulator
MCQVLLRLNEAMKMVIGVTMVKAFPGQERSAYSAIKDKDEVRKVYHTFGECDFLAVIHAEDLPALRDVLEEIKVSLGVAGTRMIVVGEGFSERPVGGATCLAGSSNLRAECAR